MRIAGGPKTWRPVIAAFGTVALVATTAVGSAHASSLQVPAKYSSGLTMAMDSDLPARRVYGERQDRRVRC